MSSSSAGFVVAVVVVLLLGYLLPSLVRRRQAVGDARVADRFSASLRVVERRGVTKRDTTSTTALLRSATRPALHARGEETAVNRPVGMSERRTATEARQIAAVRAALAARHAEQAAAARRRLVLTLSLVLVTAVSWVAVAMTNFQFWLALFPTAVLIGVLWLGVRAARAEREEWASVPASLREPRAVAPAGPSFSASQLRRHLDAAGVPVAVEAAGAQASAAAEAEAEVEAGLSAAGAGLRWTTDPVPAGVATASGGQAAEQSELAESAVSAEGASAETWTPTAVPVPTYTLKASAPRREVVPVAEGEGADAVGSVEAQSFESQPFESQERGTVADDPVGIDLNAVLARRRAV